MSKPDEYRANAQECHRMAGISRKPNEKALWQQMAQRWLRRFLKWNLRKVRPVRRPPTSHSDQDRKVSGGREAN